MMERSFKMEVNIDVLRVKPDYVLLTQSLTTILHDGSHQSFH